MLVEFYTLNKMFEQNPDKSQLSFNSCCQSCGCQLTIEINKLPSGFGLKGGVIFESNSDQLFAKCDACYQNKIKLACIEEKKVSNA